MRTKPEQLSLFIELEDEDQFHGIDPHLLIVLNYFIPGDQTSLDELFQEYLNLVKMDLPETQETDRKAHSMWFLSLLRDIPWIDIEKDERNAFQIRFI